MGFLGSIGDAFKNIGETFIKPFESVFNIGSSILGGMAANDAQESANRTNVDLARESWSWQERMANSAHQRAVSDLKKAGLNPLLALNNGAVTPGISAPRVESAANLIQNTTHSASARALEYAQLRESVATQKAERFLKEKQSEFVIAEQASVNQDTLRKSIENELLQKKAIRAKYLLDRTNKALPWEGFKDDWEGAIKMINPIDILMPGLFKRSGGSFRDW